MRSVVAVELLAQLLPEFTTFIHRRLCTDDVHVDGDLHVRSGTQPAGNKGAQFERWQRFTCRIRVQGRPDIGAESRESTDLPTSDARSPEFACILGFCILGADTDAHPVNRLVREPAHGGRRRGAHLSRLGRITGQFRHE